MKRDGEAMLDAGIDAGLPVATAPLTVVSIGVGRGIAAVIERTAP